jgi:hypothetical protein
MSGYDWENCRPRLFASDHRFTERKASNVNGPSPLSRINPRMGRFRLRDKT